MFRVLPTAYFANVQRRLFPIYFSIQSVAGFIVAYSMHKHSTNYYQKAVAYSSLFCAILESLVIAPTTIKAMDVYLTIKREEGEESDTEHYKQAKLKFYTLHGVSALVNMANLLLQTVHIYYLAQSGKFSM